MKLLAVTFLTTIPNDQLAGLKFSRKVDLVLPATNVLGWRVLLRGPAVVLLAPDGTGHEFARAQCVLTWSGRQEDYDKLTNYTSDPIARAVPPPSEAEIEKLTAPAKAGAK